MAPSNINLILFLILSAIALGAWICIMVIGYPVVHDKEYDSITLVNGTFIGNVVCRAEIMTGYVFTGLSIFPLIITNSIGWVGPLVMMYILGGSLSGGFTLFGIIFTAIVQAGPVWNVYNEGWQDYEDNDIYPVFECDEGYEKVFYNGLYNSTGCVYFNKIGRPEDYLTICCADYDESCEDTHDAFDRYIIAYSVGIVVIIISLVLSSIIVGYRCLTCKECGKKSEANRSIV